MAVAFPSPEQGATRLTHAAYDAEAKTRRYLPALGVIGAAGIAALTPLSEDEGLVLCPFRLATGGYCPGCGGTRAAAALVRGDFGLSLKYNPLALIVALHAIAISAFFAVKPDVAGPWWRENSWKVLKPLIAAGLVVWIVRLGAGAIPVPFS